MADWTSQRYWEDVAEGDSLPALGFPLSVHRLIVAAGASKDFAQIHHNTEVARAQGAGDMYASNVLLLGMWERVVREYIGLDGVIVRIGPLRMKQFATAGETVTVRASVTRKWSEDDRALVEIALRSEISTGDAVTGVVRVALPRRTPVAQTP
ncbi:hypothetical protein [Sporichthya sp.]|uniref:hypothetical protein n=1 Tax=Sporichthya sp. TaxID=65475 RepID=UPI0017D11090|nr:hypothetical protein [Sporichthya sp.]MBA3741441.1 acyl dehydratase [Sporichthya sp.]